MNKSASLPEIKGLKKLKRREQKKINRSVVRRLYSHEIKKIKLKNNSFMYKKPEDVSLEKQVNTTGDIAPLEDFEEEDGVLHDLIEDDEEFTLSIAQQKEQLTFVKTRIKVIMTTLPKLRENLETWSKNSTHFTTISKKIEKLVTLLKTYETTKLMRHKIDPTKLIITKLIKFKIYQTTKIGFLMIQKEKSDNILVP